MRIQNPLVFATGGHFYDNCFFIFKDPREFSMYVPFILIAYNMSVQLFPYWKPLEFANGSQFFPLKVNENTWVLTMLCISEKSAEIWQWLTNFPTNRLWEYIIIDKVIVQQRTTNKTRSRLIIFHLRDIFGLKHYEKLNINLSWVLKLAKFRKSIGIIDNNLPNWGLVQIHTRYI